MTEDDFLRSRSLLVYKVDRNTYNLHENQRPLRIQTATPETPVWLQILLQILSL